MGRSDTERERCPRLYCTYEVSVDGPEHNRCAHPEQPHGGLCCWPCDRMERIPSGRIDWKSRALAAEARIREVLDLLQPGRIMYWDSFAAIRAILTRDPQPAPATDPTNPATVLRALILQEPVERTPDGLRVVSTSAETGARGDA